MTFKGCLYEVYPETATKIRTTLQLSIVYPEKQTDSRTKIHYNMKYNQSLSFAEKERICEALFLQEGPFWHLCTDGTKMQNIFTSGTDFDLGMNLLSVSACRKPGVRIVAFELMSNHVHKILCGQKEACMGLFEDFKGRMKRIFRRSGRIIDWESFTAEIIPIEDLRALRNEIIYTHRNAYVSQSSYTPYNYPWGSGIAYFNPLLKSIPAVSFNDLTYDSRRAYAHVRDISRLGALKFHGERAYIPSFCDVSLGESLFNDPRSYFNSLTKNVEAFSEIASRLKDTVFLTDDELYAVASRYSAEEFNVRQLSALSPDQRIRIAKELHFKYNASNQQLRRLLKLDVSLLNEMFIG